MNKRRSLLLPLLRNAAGSILVLLLAAGRLNAQADLFREKSFKQIQDDLSGAIESRDPARQALAWYTWALYDEQKAGNRDSVYAYMDKSAALYLSIGDTVHYYRVRNELARRMAGRDLTDEALRTQLQALEYFRRKNDQALQVQMMAAIYRVYLWRGDTTTANEWRKQFVDLNRTVKDTALLVMIQLEKVYDYQNRGQFQDAAHLSLLTLRDARTTGQRDLIAEIEYNIGAFSRRTGKPYIALEYLRQAEQSVLPGNYVLRRKIYRDLYETYQFLDSMSVAADYAILFGQLSDTLLARDRASARYRTAYQFDAGKKLQEINTLEKEKKDAEALAAQQRKVTLAVTALLILVLFTAGIIVLAYQQRQKARRTIANQKAEIDRMQAILEGQESERERIAHDLHDSLGGLLAAAKIQLEGLPAKQPGLAASPDWRKLRDLLDDTVAEVRQIARNLLPVALIRFGLVAAIQDLVSRVRGEGVPPITFQHFGDFSGLPNMKALHCFRIVQELLQNSLKYAGASEILVQLTRTDHEIALLVEDDGKGFDPATSPKGMGTHNVAQRVQFMQGVLSVQTAPGEGVSVHVTIPVANS